LANASSPTYTEGDQVLTSVNLQGNTRVTMNQVNGQAVLTGNGVTGTGSLRVTIASDNTANTNPWLVSQVASASGGYSYSHISAATTTTSKSGAGTLHSITINTRSVGGTATIYDNTAGSGTVIAVLDTTLSTTTFIYDVAFSTGLTIVTADGGATHADLTVAYK